MKDRTKFGRRVRVRCVETRKVYPSIMEASRQTGLEHSLIYRSALRRLKPGYKPYKGNNMLHWEFVGNLELQRYGSPVRNRDTGEIFPTIKAAANSIGMLPSTFRKNLKKGKLSYGYRFERIKDYEFRYDTNYMII